MNVWVTGRPGAASGVEQARVCVSYSIVYSRYRERQCDLCKEKVGVLVELCHDELGGL